LLSVDVMMFHPSRVSSTLILCPRCS
jgi:hypothetical protein